VTLAVLWLAFLVMFVLTVAAPAAAALWLRFRIDVPIRVFEASAGFYLVSLAIQLPVSGQVAGRGLLLGPLLGPLLAPAIYALSEESLRYLSFRAGRAMRSSRHDDGALMAGLGFGVMEALIFALILTWTVVLVTFAPESLRAQGIDPTQTASGVVGSGAVYCVSRLGAIACHLGFSTLSVLAYRRSVAFLPVVIAAHFAFNASTAGLQALGGPWWVPAMIAWAAASILVVVWVRRAGWIQRTATAPTPHATAAFAWPGTPPPPP